jgi:hypothetical protein
MEAESAVILLTLGPEKHQRPPPNDPENGL